MARPKKDKVEANEPIEVLETSKSMLKFLKGINSDSAFLSDNSLSIVSEFIDTGNYALNGIISGSLYGGVPRGIITGFSGISQSGKTFIAAKIVANAQKKGYRPIIWDSEGSWDQSMTNLGVDIDSCFVMPVATVEDVKNQMMKTLEKIKATGSSQKYIFVLDSLGALSSQKEMDDSLKEKTNPDMGTRAKVIKSMARQLAIQLKTLKIPMVFTNHIYENPAQMYKSAIKNQSGGLGPQYLSTILVQMGVKHENTKVKKENGEKEANPEDSTSSDITGSFIPTMTVKNRIAKNFLKTTLYINYSRGLDRYSGLFAMGRQLGVILGNRTYTLADGTKLGQRKEVEMDINLWETVIIPAMEPAVNAEFKHNAEEIANTERVEYAEYDDEEDEGSAEV